MNRHDLEAPFPSADNLPEKVERWRNEIATEFLQRNTDFSNAGHWTPDSFEDPFWENLVKFSLYQPRFVRAAERGDIQAMVEDDLNQGPDSHDERGITALIAAAAAGQEKMVQYLLESGANPNMRDVEGRTPIYVAASIGHREIVKALKNHGADIDLVNEEGTSPINEAVKRGDISMVKTLLDLGADHSSLNDHGRTTLDLARRSTEPSKQEIERELLDHGAKTSHQVWEELMIEAVSEDARMSVAMGEDYSYDRNLHSAIHDGYERAAEYFLVMGANPNKGNYRGRTPLHTAIETGQMSLAKLLIGHRANINILDVDGKSPLDLTNPANKEELQQLFDEIQKLIPVKIPSTQPHPQRNDAFAPRLEYNPMFVYDAIRNDDESIKSRIEMGESPNAYDELGRTALIGALEGSDNRAVSVIPRLMAEGADPNIANPDRQLPLHIAAKTGNHRAVELLLTYGSEINALDRFGKTPLDLSKEYERDQVADLLHSEWALTGAEVSERLASALDIEIASDKNTKTANLLPRTNSAFVKDAEQGRTDELLARINRGESPDSVNDLGDSALLRAVQNKHESTIRLLLESGASATKAEQDQYTPLHEAARLGNLSMVKSLLKHGATVNSLSHDVSTPLDLCNTLKHAEVRAYLQSKGAESGEKVFTEFLNDRDTKKNHFSIEDQSRFKPDRNEIDLEL